MGSKEMDENSLKPEMKQEHKSRRNWNSELPNDPRKYNLWLFRALVLVTVLKRWSGWRLGPVYSEELDWRVSCKTQIYN